MNQCPHCQKQFEIPQQDKDLYLKWEVSVPTLCMDCRRRRRLAFWPYGILQKRKCDFSGEDIISTFSPQARFPVYKRQYWFGDGWEPPQAEIDWNRSFFEQLYDLQCKTPHFHQQGKQNENCDYADDVWECKNCYMSRSMAGCEDLSYCYRVLYSSSNMDLTYCYHTQQSYECTYCFKCYSVKFCFDCKECKDSLFLYDCRGCSDCFMCWNLRNKQYCIKNKQYSREDYEKIIDELGLDSRKNLENFNNEFLQHLQKDAYYRATININSENCEGNYLTDSKGCRDCYFLENCEDDVYEMRCPQTKDCMDCNGLFRGELCYEIAQSTDLNNVRFGLFATDCNNCSYVDQCVGCSDCFGCVGLKRKQYCILNKQYSREEYESLVPRIIDLMREREEWGEFFPYKFAYNGFNLSLAAFYYDETPDSIAQKGGFWEREPGSVVGGINGEDLPDSGEEISDDLLGKPVNCAQTGRPYKFVKHELDFYKRHKLPLPKYYPEYRNKLRYSRLMPLNPREIVCADCGGKITTYYPQSWGYKHILCVEFRLLYRR